MSIRLVKTGISELLPMKRYGDPMSHVSVIIRELAIAAGHFEERDDTDDPPQTMWELGSAFERAIIDGLVRRYAQHEPDKYVVLIDGLSKDGLLGNPDLLEPDEEVLHEIKLSWMSSRHDPEGTKFWKYWVQVMAYLYMLGWNRAWLHVAHINGNYKKFGPVYNVWERTFTQQELVENWKMLKSHHRRMLERRQNLDAYNASQDE